jgi:hypothetical protein
MRARLLALALLVPSTALADETPETAEAVETRTGDASTDVEAEVVAQGDVAYASARVVGTGTYDHAVDYYHLILAGTASAEARGGTDAPLAAHTDFSVFFGDVDAPGLPTAGLMVMTIRGSTDLAGLPRLDSRRDVHRGAYSGAAVSGTFVGLRGGNGRRRYEFLEVGMGGARSRQTDDTGSIAHREETMHGAFGRSCRLRARPAPDACVTIIPFDALGVTGGSSAAVGTFYPATWSGIGVGGGLYADFGIGGGGTGTMTTEENGEVVSTIETEDLPNVGAAVGFAAVHGQIGAVAIDVRAARDFYLTIDGDLALDDRVRAELDWTHGRSAYSARAFAARTLWWTSKSDAGHREVTGGLELGVRRPVRFVELDASVGAARSFYGVLDGTAADRAGVAGTARLTLRRNVKTVTW